MTDIIEVIEVGVSGSSVVEVIEVGLLSGPTGPPGPPGTGGGGGGAPSGPAGGALAGTYPNPTLASAPNNTVKGNVSGSAAAPSDLTGSVITALLDVVTTANKGVAPASGGGTTNFLRADGTWAAPPAGGGGAPTSRLINTTAPLTGGGDLTADRTLGVSAFSSGASGVVPASGGGTANFLRADGTWNTPPSGGGGAPTGAAGGALAGSYPNPTLAAGAVGPTELALGAVNSSLKIGNNAVDDTKLVDIPTATVKGRVAAGTGDPTNLTATDLTTLINPFSPTLKGVVPASGGGPNSYLNADGTWGTLPVYSGTAVDGLVSNIGGGGTTNFFRADGTWAAPPGGGLLLNIINTEKTANYTAAPNEFVLFNTTTGARTLTLPTAPANGTLCGCRITTLGTGNFVTVTCGGTDVFTKAGSSGTQATVLQYNGQGIVYEYNAGVWQPIMSNHSLFGLDSRYVQTANLVTLNPGLDLEMSAVVGGVQTVGVTPAQHAFWQPQYITAAADQGPVQSTAGLFNDATLVLPVVANASYELKLHLIYDSTPGTGLANFRVGFTVPAGSTLQYCVPAAPHTSWTGTGVALQFGPYQLNAGGSGAVIGCCALGTPTEIEAMGTLVIGGTAGNLTFQWAQGTSAATNTTRKAGSTLILRRYA